MRERGGTRRRTLLKNTQFGRGAREKEMMNDGEEKLSRRESVFQGQGGLKRF